MANQNEGELHPEEIPVQEGLPHVEDERTLRDYTIPRVEQNMSSIHRPIIVANSFEIKVLVIQMIGTNCVFNGLPNKDPNKHLQNFGEICDTFNYNRILEDFIMLKMFPFSLRSNT